jgi:perosamine synthetase
MIPDGGRHLALLGGTTTWGDFFYASARLAVPVRLVDGPALRTYEQRLAPHAGCRYATAFWAGRVGLYGLLGALGIGPGDEVIMPVPSHIVVANAIRYHGATPVYVDCRLTDYNIDVEQAAAAVTSRTRALIVQHSFGFPADIEAAMALAQQHGLTVIEDCVHALGSTVKDRPVGSFGHAAFFSTEETKIISTTMGGAVTTNDESIDRRMRSFQSECAPPGFSLVYRYLLKLALYHCLLQPRVHRYVRAVYEALGRRLPLPRPTDLSELNGDRPDLYEARFSNAQAEIGIRQLDTLPANLAHRRRIAAVYAAQLQQWGMLGPEISPQACPAYVRFPLWVTDRAEAERRYRRYGVLGTWFSSVLEEAVDPERIGYVAGSCPNAERAGAHLINLPTHPRVSEADALRLIAVVRDLISTPDQRG